MWATLKAKTIKVCLVTREDFLIMYGKYPNGKVTLWCDSHKEDEDSTGGRKKRKRDDASSKRQEKEEEVDDILKRNMDINMIPQDYVCGLGPFAATYMMIWIASQISLHFMDPRN